MPGSAVSGPDPVSGQNAVSRQEVMPRQDVVPRQDAVPVPDARPWAGTARFSPVGAAAALAVALALVPALVYPVRTSAAEIEGVRFDDVAEVAGRPLRLNGAGLREVYVVKTWVAALYAPDPIDNAPALVGDPGPRRIAITLLADLSIERVARDILDAVRRNHDPLLLVTIEKQIDAFVAVLKSIGPTVKRDTLTLDFADGATRIGFNGMTVGEPIVGLLFRDAVLRAFVWDEPIDEGLKQGLLGPPPPPSPPETVEQPSLPLEELRSPDEPGNG
jgi:hypothetical protein